MSLGQRIKPGRNLNRVPPKYKIRALSPILQFSWYWWAFLWGSGGRSEKLNPTYVSILNDIMNEKIVLPIDVLLILFGVVVLSTFRKNVSPSFRVEACKMGGFLRTVWNTTHFQRCKIPTRSILTIYHRQTLKSVYFEIYSHLDRQLAYLCLFFSWMTLRTDLFRQSV